MRCPCNEESGLSERPTRVRTWAPKGCTPVVQFHFNWKHVSAIAGLTRANFLFRLYDGAVKSDEKMGMFRTRRGTAPDIAGKGIAHPVSTILSAAMRLDWLAAKQDDERCTAAARATRESRKSPSMAPKAGGAMPNGVGRSETPKPLLTGLCGHRSGCFETLGDASLAERVSSLR